MRFFATIAEDSVAAGNFPPPAMFEMVEATMGWLDEQTAANKVDWFWIQADRHGGFMMFNVDSHAELFRLIESIPARPFMQIETTAVISRDEWTPLFAEAKERAMKMFAAMQPH